MTAKKERMVSLLDVSLFAMALLVTFFNCHIHYHGTALYEMVRNVTTVFGFVLIGIRIKENRFLFLSFLCVALTVVVLFSGYINDGFINYSLGDILFMAVMMIDLWMVVSTPFAKQRQEYRIYFLLLIGVITLIDLLCVLNGGRMNGRFKGIASHPNQLAAMNVVLVFLSFYIGSYEKGLKKLTFLFLSLCGFLIIVLTNSRTSLLVCAIFFVLYLFIWLYERVLNKSRFFLLTMIVVVLGVLLILLLWEPLSTFLLRGGAIENASFTEMLNALTSGRWNMWMHDFPKMMEGHWLFGRGIGTVDRLAEELQMFQSIIRSDALLFLHNFFFDTFYNGGILGLFYLVLMVVVIFLFVFKRWKNQKEQKSSLKKIVLMILTLFLLFCFDINFIWEVQFVNLFFFVLVGYLMNMVGRAGAEYEK